MFAPHYHLLDLLFLLFAARAWAASSDSTCITTCSDYSIVLGHCRQRYWVNPTAGNETNSQDFVGCLCNGEENDKVLGQDAFLISVGICQSCGSTPARVQDDLSTLLELCAIMQANGSAEEAASFSPVGYTTSEDARGRFPGDDGYGQDTGETSSAARGFGVSLTGFAAMGAFVGGVISL